MENNFVEAKNPQKESNEKNKDDLSNSKSKKKYIKRNSCSNLTDNLKFYDEFLKKITESSLHESKHLVTQKTKKKLQKKESMRKLSQFSIKKTNMFNNIRKYSNINLKSEILNLSEIEEEKKQSKKEEESKVISPEKNLFLKLVVNNKEDKEDKEKNNKNSPNKELPNKLNTKLNLKEDEKIVEENNLNDKSHHKTMTNENKKEHKIMNFEKDNNVEDKSNKKKRKLFGCLPFCV